MGLARAVCSCDHEGCDAMVDLRVSPAADEDTPDLLEIARAIAEQRGWQCQLEGEPRDLQLDPPPGYGFPSETHCAEGRDLCPQHVEAVH